ncbi:magnesium transporters: cora family [Ostreococcus tauri]|uniref:Magnesium transporter n=1 Tax=Ostreococcus tauri TaxID=70448 RepID=A0A1Y5IAF3_OSTTA|nr:magnesium transporters: cora family [Ostreococcus tauri]
MPDADAEDGAPRQGAARATGASTSSRPSEHEHLSNAILDDFTRGAVPSRSSTPPIPPLAPRQYEAMLRQQRASGVSPHGIDDDAERRSAARENEPSARRAANERVELDAGASAVRDLLGFTGYESSTATHTPAASIAGLEDVRGANGEADLEQVVVGKPATGVGNYDKPPGDELEPVKPAATTGRAKVGWVRINAQGNVNKLSMEKTKIATLLRGKTTHQTTSSAKTSPEKSISQATAAEEFPFEFIALEVALEMVCNSLEVEANKVELDSKPALEALRKRVDNVNLERVRRMKTRLVRVSGRVSKVREEIQRYLDDDSDMRDMYLTRKAKQEQETLTREESTDTPTGNASTQQRSTGGRPPLEHALSMSSGGGPVPRSPLGIPTTAEGVHPYFDHFDDDKDLQELEDLLETYFTHIDSTHRSLNGLNEYIDDLEDLIEIELDSQRNRLIQLELILTTATLCLTCFSVVVGIFGMNIKNNIENRHDMFLVVEDLKHFPAYLRALMRAMVNRKTSDAEPNHVLVNEYESRGGITPHSDGAVYAEDVSILTLRGTALIEFWPSEGEITGRPIASVLLEPRSVLTYKGAAYRLRHGIRETDADVVTEETANARALGLNPGARVERNPRGRVSVVFVRKRTVV